jgi:putative ABC transport system permease protein
MNSSIYQDLRYAVRSLVRLRGLALIAIGTLALGIGATTTMFSVVYAALMRPLPFVQSDRLVIIFNTRLTARDGLQQLRWSRRHIITLQRDATSFEAIASSSSTSIAISEHGDPEQIDGEVVSPAYFATLRVSPIAGRVFRPEEDTVAGAHPMALISERLWRRRFESDPATIGGTVRINDIPLTVIGILPEDFRGLSGKADVWFPPAMAARLTYDEYLTTPQHFITVVARLRSGVALEHANAELSALGGRFADEGSPPTTTWGVVAVPLGRARVDATYRRSAFVLLAAASCVLLTACVNVASLLLARARSRRREIAIRLAIGSSRGRLIQQLLTEGAVLAAVAGACGVLLATWGMDLFARSVPPVVPTAANNYAAVSTFGMPALDAGVVLFALVVTLGTTFVFALAPALQASRPELTTALKDDDRGGGHGRAMGALVVTEVALAMLLLAGSGVLIESFMRIQNRRTGFAPDGVLTFWLRPPASRYAPADGPRIVERLLQAVQAVPGVESAAVNRCTPFTGCSRTIAFVPDRPGDTANAPGTPVGRHYVSADYFRTLGIPLKSGRALTDRDRAGASPVTVVNEAGARRFWPGENPIGKRVWFGSGTGFTDPARPVEVIGVAGDVKYEGVEQPDMDRPEFYTSYLQFSFPDTMVLVKGRGATVSLLPAVRSAVASVDPALPIYDAMMLDDRIAAAVSRPRFNAALVSAFAASALLLAAVGVYGVLSYSVSSRMRELGVRLALGAGAAQVVSLVVGDGLRLAATGTSAGALAAVFASRLLQGVVFGVSTSNGFILTIGGGLIMAVAGIAAFLPARRAGSIDPVQVLRTD